MAPRLAALFAALALLAGCAPERLPGETSQGDSRTERTSDDEDEGLPVAAVDGRVITTSEFDLRLELRSPAATVLYSPPPRRATLLDLFVTIEIIANDAARRGLAGSPWETTLIDEARARGWLSTLVGTRVGLAAISDEDIDVRWEERRDEFNFPEQRAFATIVLEDRAAADALLATIRSQIDDGYERPAQLFARFAWQHSIDEATRAGDGFAGRIVHPDHAGQANRALADAVFTLTEPGDVGGPVHTSRGWELVQLRSIYPPRQVSLDDARAILREQMAEELAAHEMRAELDRMNAAATVVRDDDMVARLVQARVGGDPEPTRPRRWEPGGLSASNARIVGVDAAEELRAQTAVLDNPLAAIPPATEPAPPEGSADAAPGSDP